MFLRDIFILIFIFSSFSFGRGIEEQVEVTCNINVKKPLHCVNEKFLSLSVDPAVLLAGVNLSESSLCLAKHLSPAFIRIAGPTTQFVKYSDLEENSHKFLSEDGSSVRISPSMWFGINEWLKLAKLTPIFGINDCETDNDLWNPKSTLPLFDISEQLNVSCYWQLGYDNSHKNRTRYTQNLKILHYILEAYGERNNSWKIVGSDISAMPENQIENIIMELNDITESVMWEPSDMEAVDFPRKDVAYKILQRPSSKSKVNVWTTVPKSSGPVTFSSALLWAKQIGNAAAMGYDVVFRQPRIHELFTDTPVYWASLLFKKLMGCNVLETKSNLFQENVNIFAHCTRKQNSFVRRGALTIMVVNEQATKYNVKIKLGNSFPEKSMEVQNYVLTSNNLNSTETYLNGNLLTPKAFNQKQPFEPKIHRSKSSTHLILALPPSSIGFFVLPGARVPACIENENETHLLLEEIEEDQKMPLSEEIALQLGQRSTFIKHNLLEEITNKLKNEITVDERFYNNLVKQNPTKSMEDPSKEIVNKIDEKERKHFIDRVKHKKVFDLEKKRENLKKYMLNRKMKMEPKPEITSKKLELSSDEIDQLLKDRAVERAAQKNIVFTDEELEALLKKASKNFHNSRSKRSASKRAINLPMVEKYSRMNQVERHQRPIKQRTSIFRNKNHARGRRAVNVDLSDLKAKIAERKRFWEDKREEILGNSLIFKENIKDKIRGLKSNYRFKRDINMDLLNKNTKDTKTVKSHKAKEAIEATIRQSGQTSSAVIDDMEDTEFEDSKPPQTEGEIFAELADSEELEEQLFNDANKAVKNKKLKLFDKKPKVDPFGVEYAAIEVVEPTRRKHKSKPKTKSDDRLQFLTTSEEFTDIEEDLPCIHEFFGPEYSNKKSGKGTFPEVNEYFGQKIFKKRSVAGDSEEGVRRKKRDMGIAIIQIFDNQMPPTDDILQNLILDDPVLDRPFLNKLFKFNGKLDDDALKNTYYEIDVEDIATTTAESEDKSNAENKDSDEVDGLRQELSRNNVNETRNNATRALKTNSKESNETSESTTEPNPGLETVENDQHVKRKRSIENPLRLNDGKKFKLNQGLDNLNDQMQLIRDKLQERKDELDRLVQKQRESGNEKKEQWKSKLNGKTRSHKKIDFKKFGMDSPKLFTRLNKGVEDVENHESKVRRSIFESKNQEFGDYQSLTSNLKEWQPSDVAVLKKDYQILNSNLIPPNDQYIFNNIFKKPYNIRKRRYIDTDIEDFPENAIDTSVNEIRKDREDFKFYRNKNFADFEDNQIYKTDKKKEDTEHVLEEVSKTNLDSKGDKTVTNEPGHLSSKETNETQLQEPDKNEEDVASLDVTFTDNLFRLKLPNDDELDLINDGDDTEIKLIHNLSNDKQLTSEEVEGIIPEILPRGVTRIDSVDTFIGDVTKFFNHIGKELKTFFNKFTNKL